MSKSETHSKDNSTSSIQQLPTAQIQSPTMTINDLVKPYVGAYNVSELSGTVTINANCADYVCIERIDDTVNITLYKQTGELVDIVPLFDDKYPVMLINANNKSYIDIKIMNDDYMPTMRYRIYIPISTDTVHNAFYTMLQQAIAGKLNVNDLPNQNAIKQYITGNQHINTTLKRSRSPSLTDKIQPYVGEFTVNEFDGIDNTKSYYLADYVCIERIDSKMFISFYDYTGRRADYVELHNPKYQVIFPTVPWTEVIKQCEIDLQFMSDDGGVNTTHRIELPVSTTDQQAAFYRMVQQAIGGQVNVNDVPDQTAIKKYITDKIRTSLQQQRLAVATARRNVTRSNKSNKRTKYTMYACESKQCTICVKYIDIQLNNDTKCYEYINVIKVDASTLSDTDNDDLYPLGELSHRAARHQYIRQHNQQIMHKTCYDTEYSKQVQPTQSASVDGMQTSPDCDSDSEEY